MGQIKLVATDLDGTFLKNDKTICENDLEMLDELGRKQIIRVAATGRNLNKVKEVIPAYTPFDYIAFSSGAGIYDWRNNQLIFSKNMHKETANAICKILTERGFSFHLFRQVPYNYKCWYYRGARTCEEFERYFDFHNSVSEPLPETMEVDEDVCQFLVIFPNLSEEFHQFKKELEDRFDEVKVIRSSSPLLTDFIWMEIFHADVSKGNAVRFLCDRANVHHQKTFGIGNDYNDLDLLEFTSFSYLVSNGPDDMKDRFLPAPSNEECAFSSSLRNHV